MRLFIDQHGKIDTLVCDHEIYCRMFCGVSLLKYLKTNVRIATHGEVFAAETRQKKLSDDQIRTIRREFRQSGCFEFIGAIGGKLIPHIKGNNKMNLQTEYRNRTNNTGHFFDLDTMRFFNSRIGRSRPCKNGVWYFVTSEKPPHGSRCYSVRKMELDGDINTISEFCSLTAYMANKLVNEYAEAENN